MILDKQNTLAEAQSIATTAEDVTYNIGDVIDLAVAGRNIAAGDNPYVLVRIDTAVTSTAATTVDFKLVGSASATISTTGGATELWSSGAIAKATLAANYQVDHFKLPKTSLRYLGFQVRCGTHKADAGKADCFITLQPKEHTIYKGNRGA